MKSIVQSLVLGVLVLAASFSAHARMYQWVSSSSSVPQLSGEPPPWYRSEHGGPRVRVFENGNLVDDTAIALPPAQREELRADAFHRADERRRADAVKRLERAARREAVRRAEQERIAEARKRPKPAPAVPEVAKVEEAPSESPASKVSDGPITDDAVAQLKAIIAEFDRRGGQRK